MIVTYKDDVSTLDPAIGYDWQNWSMIKCAVRRADGLQAGHHRARARTSPRATTISDDGTDLHLQAAQGRQVPQWPRADRRRRQVFDRARHQSRRRRARAPASSARSPAMTTWPAARRPTLSGIDGGRSQHGRDQAEPARRHLPARAWRSTSPPSCPRKRSRSGGADFGKHPVGTGAFKLAEWTLGQRIVFERNPDYWTSRRAQSRQDHLRGRPGADGRAAAPAEGRGRHRSATASRRPSSSRSRTTRPSKDLIVEGDQLHTGYVTMNVNMPPFDNVKVRQAVNMAINKERIVRIINNRAVPANQPLPPPMPGYDQGLQGLSPTIPRRPRSCSPRPASPDGFTTELYVNNIDPQPAHRPGDPAGSGRHRHQGRDQVAGPGQRHRRRRRPGQAPMIWSGGMAWIADFPDPSNFYGPILGCAGAVAGRLELVVVLQQGPRRQGRSTADAMVDPAKAAERAEHVARHLHRRSWTTRPGCRSSTSSASPCTPSAWAATDALFIDPMHIPVNYDYVFAKDAQ